MTTARPASFKDAYQTLQRHAETLRNQREPDLDNLLTIVTESVAAYQVCKARIEAVEQALEEALSGAGVGDDAGADVSAGDAGAVPDDDAPAPPGRGARAADAAPFDPDEEIPF